MQFSENEIRFLLNRHSVETAAGPRTLSHSTDLRALGCPAATFNRILESRAKQLGRKFAEFRNTGRATVPQSTPTLESQIASSKLF